MFDNSQKLVECEQRLLKKDRQLSQTEERLTLLESKFIDQQSKLLNCDDLKLKEKLGILSLENVSLNFIYHYIYTL